MADNLEDPRRFKTLEHIRAARHLLETAQANRLDHTDVAIVQAAYDGLGIVLRILSGTSLPNDAVLAARLRGVAASLLECSAPNGRLAYSAVLAAAEISLSTAEGAERSIV